VAGPAPSVAATRVAVRRILRGTTVPGPNAKLPDPALSPRAVLVACSGGPDSVALASATAFVAPRLGLTAGLVTVDHGLQPGSDVRAKQVAEWGASVGLAPAIVARVTVPGRPGGPEAAARDARYEVLVEAGLEHEALILLGHTREDQAETVLLALARGAGPRGLAGMPQRRVRDGVTFLRPFLALSRADTRAACSAQGLVPWDDPHNADPAYARARVRAALPVLAELLGPDVVPNLARTARLVAADVTALDALAAAVDIPERGLAVAELAGLPVALRTRVLRAFVLRLGVPGGALATAHLDALDSLVMDWRGQGPVALPGGIQVSRRDGWLSGPGTSTGTRAESPPPAG
jgi:tRNA(Ile)-lysidine synthase